jgi:hypothetical protein
MATCPRCKGPLTDGHRCPKRRSLVALELTASALAGGLASWLLLVAFDPFQQIADMDVISIVAGALAGIAINRFIRS